MNKTKTILFLLGVFGILVTVFYLKTQLIKDEQMNTTRENLQEKVDAKKSELNLYFGNKNNISEGENCEAKSVVKRTVPYSITVEKDAIDELLKGPNDEEVKNGFYSNINRSTKLLSINVENGVAKADFSKELSEGVAGSCNVLFLRSQIENTLKSFPAVKEVVLSINGKTDAILEP